MRIENSNKNHPKCHNINKTKSKMSKLKTTKF